MLQGHLFCLACNYTRCMYWKQCLIAWLEAAAAGNKLAVHHMACSLG